MYTHVYTNVYGAPITTRGGCRGRVLPTLVLEMASFHWPDVLQERGWTACLLNAGLQECSNAPADMFWGNQTQIFMLARRGALALRPLNDVLSCYVMRTAIKCPMTAHQVD